MSDLAPAFLIAVPQLGDPNFQRSVVLMLEHTEEGALGIVINRPGRLTLGEVGASQGLVVEAGLRAGHVFVGGPVQAERGFVLHTRDDLPDSVRLVDGLWVSSSIEVLKWLLSSGDAGWRLCLGYAGWGAGQLESELREGAWLAAKATSAHALATEPKQLWEAVIRDMGIEPSRLVHTTGLH